MCITLPCGYSSQTLAKLIAYCEIAIYVIALLMFSLFGVLLESKPDLLKTVAEDNPADYNDLIVLLNLPRSIQTGCILWFIMTSVAGLIFSLILLQGAQEKNATKVKIWFVVTLVSYIASIPVYLFWMCHSSDWVSVGFTVMMSYVFGALCLWVVYSFMEEMRIENISHRPGFKTQSSSLYKI